MAIVFMESFDLVGSNADLQKKGWSVAEGSVGVDTGAFGGQGYSISGNVSNVLSKGLLFKRYTTVSFYFKNNATVLGSGYFCSIQDSSAPTSHQSGSHAAISFSNSGQVVIHESISSDVVGASDTGVISPSTWHHIEIQFDINSSGTVGVWVDGDLAVQAAGNFDRFDDGVNTSPVFYGDEDVNVFDDIVIQTDATTQPPILGDHRMYGQLPSADTAQADFTGTYADIDDPIGASDGDATYITATTLNSKSEFEIEDLPVSPNTIHAVQIVTEARKTDAGTKLITPYILSGTTREDGDEVGTSETYSVATSIHELNPDTTAAWDTAAINALKVGIEITG
jgi:hypothetical protein